MGLRVSLALGSGGARGYAHIGVIEELERRGHDIVAVSGSSMGALVGGVFAAGALESFTTKVRGLSRTDVVRYMDVAINEPGLIKARRVMTLLNDLVGEVRIEDLPIPYTAVATDIVNRREVWFRRGQLLAAIRASIAIPTVLTPVMIDDRLLVDGGVLNPLPIEPSMHMQSDITVGVSLLGRDPGLSRSSPWNESADETKEVSWVAKVGGDVKESQLYRRLAEILPGNQQETSTGPFQPLPNSLGLTDVLLMTMDAMQASIQQTRVAVNPPDVLIEVPSRSCGILDFHLADPMIDLGRELATQAFDRLGL